MAVLAELLTVSLVSGWVQTSVKDLLLGKYENCMHVCKPNEKNLVAVAANLALFRCVDLASYPGPAQLGYEAKVDLHGQIDVQLPL